MDYSDDDLGRMILSWSSSATTKDVEIPNMPERDDSTSLHYLKSFELPLIKQTGARILSSLKSISQSAYYSILAVSKRESDGLSFIDIDTSYGDHIVQEGDLFLLSSQRPKQLQQLNKDSWIFALAADIGHNNHYVKAFPANTIGDITSELRYAILLCNISEDVCIWNTLHIDIGDRTLIKQLSSPSVVAKNCPICATKMKASDLLMNCDLNEAQKRLATTMILRANCGHGQSIDVALGLAGTGKTKTVSVVLAALVKSNVRTLVCAPNVVQCSSLSCYLHDLIKDQSVGDVLLLCDMEEMKSNLAKQFCLEWKINETMPCMLWRGKMQNLISFLEKDFRELYKGGIKGTLSVLDLLKELFGRKANTLTKLLETLQKYFPRNVFSQEAAKQLVCLFDALKGFNDLLAKEAITNEDVMTAFGIYSGTDSMPKTWRTKFSCAKNPRAAKSSTPVQLKPTFVAEIRKSKDKCLKHLKWLENKVALPYEKDTEWIRRYLIEKATVILSLPGNAVLLHKSDISQMKMLVVVGAEQIPESQLLPTLSLPSIEHAWLIGDHAQLCPTVKSQVSEDNNFGLSLFEKLISLELEDHMLTTQYRMHPEICSLANSYFYEGKLSSAKSACVDVLKSRFENYMFVNVDVERAPDAIIFLIRKIFDDWKTIPTTEYQDKILEVGVVCSAENQKLPVGCDIGQISLSLQPFGKLKSKVYDILIIAAEGLPSNKNIISYLITRARQHLWILGDEAKFATNSIWKSLIDYARQQDSFIESTSYSGLSSSFKNNVSSWDSLSDILGITTTHNKTPREFSWLGRPHNGKLLLPPVRDQRGENHCTLHSSLATMEFLNKHRAASLIPPEDFNPTFSAGILLAKYIENHGEFGKENGTGKERMENVLGTLQKVGATSESDNTVHMLSSFREIYDSSNKNEKSLEAAACKPRQGKALIGTFLLSQNYHEYRPEDIYMFDKKRPVLSPLSRKPSSHAVMLIGGTEASSKMLLEDGYFVMQNSQGEYFGREGIGRVAMSTIQRLYEITL